MRAVRRGETRQRNPPVATLSAGVVPVVIARTPFTHLIRACPVAHAITASGRCSDRGELAGHAPVHAAPSRDRRAPALPAAPTRRARSPGPRAAQAVDPQVDLLLRADVDAARRLVEEQHLRTRSAATWPERPSADCRPRAWTCLTKTEGALILRSRADCSAAAASPSVSVRKRPESSASPATCCRTIV